MSFVGRGAHLVARQGSRINMTVSRHCLSLHHNDAIITTVFVLPVPKRPATAQFLGHPILILSLRFVVLILR